MQTRANNSAKLAQTGEKTAPTIFPKKYQQKLLNNNSQKKPSKSNKTIRKSVPTPSYYVQSLNTKSKRNKNSKKASQTPNKPPTNHLGRSVHNLKNSKNAFLKQKIWWKMEKNMVNRDMAATHPHNTGWNCIKDTCECDESFFSY